MAPPLFGENEYKENIRETAKKITTSKDNIEKSIAARASQNTPQAASSKNPPVFMGHGVQGPWSPSLQTPGALLGPKPGASVPITPTLGEVAQSYYTWDQGKKDRFLSQLSLAGYNTEGMKDSQAAQLWGSYAEQAAKYWNNGEGKALTPWDVLSMDMKQREALAAKAALTPRTTTSTNTSVDLSSEGDARAIFIQAAQSLLGRDPTAAESRTFQAALNAMERANPTVTTTTQSFVGDTLQSQEQSVTGGVGEGARTVLAMDDIKRDPEYGAFQAATNGMNWLMEAVNGG